MKSAFWMVFVSAALVPGLGAAADQSFLLPLPWSQEMAHHRGWGPEHPRMVADVDGDGRQDVVGFGRDGVWLGLSDGTSFDAALVLDQLGYLQGWRTDRHVRTVADVNGDGRADVVAFGNADVYVSLSTGSGFAFPAWAVPGFGYNQGWRVGEHVRALADVSGDGLDDIVGFGDDGVYLALATPSGVFSTPFYAVEGFCSSQGWTAARHVRTLADVNGDGRHDIVGFGDHEVWIALSTGTGFATPQYAAPGFAYHNGSWRIELHRRLLADINRDGMADIVGFGDDGVWTAVSTGSGFAPAQRASVGFGANGGWTEPRHPRFVADLNGDGWQDLVGFGDEAVYRALGGPNGFAAIQPVLRALVVTPGWDTRNLPHFVGDVDGNGMADLVAFEFEDIKVAKSSDLPPPPLPAAPSGARVTSATTSTLGIEWRDNSHDERRFFVWHRKSGSGSYSRTIVGAGVTTTVLSGLQPDTEYCIFVEAESFWSVSPPSPTVCRRTDAPPPPPQTGTSRVLLHRVFVEGPLPFVGSWGPMSGKRPVRLWMEDRLGTELVHFLRIGHSSEECFGPDHQDATVLLRDGGSIGPAEIALIYGSTPLPGTQVHFAACYSTAGGASSNVMTISFNLDWAP